MRFELLKAYYESQEYVDKLKWRAGVLQEMQRDEAGARKWFGRFMDGSPEGVIEFIEAFGYVKIPEFNNAIKPFFLFPYQKRIITHIVNAENSNQEHEILCDKPRGMGVTWINVWVLIHHWLFKKEWSAFVLSRTESEVDDGTSLPDGAIFGKIRWSLNRMPQWMQPPGFMPKGKKGTSTDMTLKLINPAMNSSIIGSSTNANAGRSRRYSYIMIDEAFFVENFETLYAALQSVSRIKVFISTVVPGIRFKKFKELAEQQGDYITLTWRDHPFKDIQWYNEMLKKAEFNEEVMKEVEPSYKVSKSSQYYPEIDQSKLAPLRYNSQLPLFASMDIGKGDLTVIIFYQYDGQYVYVISAYANKQKPLKWYMPFFAWWSFGDLAAAPTAMTDQILQLNDDTEGRRYNEWQIKYINRLKRMKKPIAYFGERAHTNRVMPLNRSVADELRVPPYRIKLLVNNKGTEFKPRRLAAQKLLPMTIFNSDIAEPYVLKLYDAISNSRYAKAANATSPESAEKPVHDAEISDYRAAYENFAVNFGRIIRHTARNDPDYRQKVAGNPFVKAMLAMLAK